MSRWVWGYVVYGLWLLLFLGLELPGYFREVPWVTLSETSWHAEATYRVLPSIMFGFLLGLSVHIRYRVPLWHAVAFGVMVALGSYFIPTLPE